jgi:hypothetical protein
VSVAFFGPPSRVASVSIATPLAFCLPASAGYASRAMFVDVNAILES